MATPLDVLMPEAELPVSESDPYEPEDWMPLNLTDDISLDTTHSSQVDGTECVLSEMEKRKLRALAYEKLREEQAEKVRKILEAKVSVPEAMRFCGDTPPIEDFRYNKHLRDYIFVPDWMEGRGQPPLEPWELEDADLSM